MTHSGPAAPLPADHWLVAPDAGSTDIVSQKKLGIGIGMGSTTGNSVDLCFCPLVVDWAAVLPGTHRI